MRRTDYSNAIELLNLWATPNMWHDKTLFKEIKQLLNKLSVSSLQLTERELQLAYELSRGLLEAMLSAIDKADDFEQDVLMNNLTDISSFHTFLLDKPAYIS